MIGSMPGRDRFRCHFACGPGFIIGISQFALGHQSHEPVKRLIRTDTGQYYHTGYQQTWKKMPEQILQKS